MLALLVVLIVLAIVLAIALDLLAMIGLGVVDTAVVVGVVVSNQEHT